MNIGIIGAGAIAKFLLNEINNDDYSNLRVQRIFVRNKEKYQTLEKMFGITLYTDMDAFLDGGIDIVVEAANIEAVVDLLPHVIKKKESVIISIGALADEKFLSEITELVDVYQHAVHLPSGAIGGLDLLQNADAMGSITNVSLTTRKPADSLIDYSIDEPVIVYEGTAANAIKKFPKNINVSIILSLAGLGLDATKVTIIADPQMEKNEHHVEMQGDFGEATVTITNNPLPENPKTSYLAAMSVLGTLQRIGKSIRIGL